MPTTYPEILVVDLEATCWQGPAPQGQRQEIIEIGLCYLDTSTLQPLDKRSILVRPEHSEISDFCTELTTITPEMVRDAPTFEEACDILITEIESDTMPLATYGAWDPFQVRKQCEWDGLLYPFGEPHFNVKSMVADKFGWRKPKGMKGALRSLGIDLAGTHHRGHDDAWNIAHILAEVLR